VVQPQIENVLAAEVVFGKLISKKANGFHFCKTIAKFELTKSTVTTEY